MLIAKNDQLGADVFPLRTGEAFASIPVGDVRPGSQITWYYSGPAGATMTLSLNRIPNSGGHIHASGPTGSLSRTSIILGPKYPQNEPVVFTAPDAAGTIEITGVASKGGSTTGQNRVHIPGFTTLAGGVGLTLTGGKPKHPGNHFGLPALVQKNQQLGAQFHAKFGKNLFVNDGVGRRNDGLHRGGRGAECGDGVGMDERAQAIEPRAPGPASWQRRMREIAMRSSPVRRVWSPIRFPSPSVVVVNPKGRVAAQAIGGSHEQRCSRDPGRAGRGYEARDRRHPCFGR